jgi:hypothetical protein
MEVVMSVAIRHNSRNELLSLYVSQGYFYTPSKNPISKWSKRIACDAGSMCICFSIYFSFKYYILRNFVAKFIYTIISQDRP